jgi:drug/metabolite transporter (DMT)-like permease
VSDTTTPEPTSTNHLRGIVSMLIAVGCFSLMDAGLKVLSPHYPPLQVAALRGLASLPLGLAWAIATAGVASLLHVRWPLHLVRGGLSVLMLAAFAYALRRLPLADAYTIFFVAPLLITALAVPMLGERVGWQRWLCIATGMGGVLIMLRPSGDSMLTFAGLAVLASAVAYSFSALMTRVLGRTDSTQSMVVWMVVLLSIGATALALPQWRTFQSAHWPALLGIAVSGAFGQVAITEAFRRAPASLVAPLEYTALAWGMGLDWLIWHVAPNTRMLTGAAVIVASGLYLLHSERRGR